MSALIARSRLRRLLMASTALVLPLAGAQAQNATWQAVPTAAGPVAATFDFNANANWLPATVPTGTATFAATTGPNISFSQLSTTLGALSFVAGAPAYNFTIVGQPAPQAVTLTGAGILNTSANAPTFTTLGNGSITFQNGTAANANFVMRGEATNNVIFQNASDAGTALFTTPDTLHPGIVLFQNNSSAANATITTAVTSGAVGGGNVLFRDNSTAGNATITNNPGVDLGGGGGARTDFGVFTGTDTPNAGTAHITNNDQSQTNFFASSSAANATIVNNSGGTTNFEDNATAAAAHITNNGGNTTFCGACSGGVVSGGSATIVNTNGGTTDFGLEILAAVGFPETSSAGTANITNDTGGVTTFVSQTTAGSATITNNTGGTTIFGTPSAQSLAGFVNGDTASAGSASITNNAGGATQFFAATTAGNATITTNSGGSVTFADISTGGNARFITNAGGTFDMSALTNSGMTAGSMEGAGNYFLGSHNLSVGGNNLSTTVSGVIGDGGASGGTGGSLTHTGTGTLTLTGANTYTGGTFLNGGTLGIGNNQAFGTGALGMADGTTLQAAGNGFNVGNNIAITGTGTVDTNGFGLTLSGIIADGASAGGLTQTGTGTLTLTGMNTYTGTTIVNGGTLALAGNGSIANSAVGVQSGTFDISQTNAGARINGLFGSPGGVTALGSRTLTISDGSLYAGVIQDGGIGGGTRGGVRIGGGEQVLMNTNTYTGLTTIDPGAQLTLSSFFGLNGSIFNSSHVLDNGTFDISGLSNGGTSIRSLAGNGGVGLGANTLTLTAASDTFAGVIGGSGGVTLTGGAQTLSGNSTYAGATNVNAGVLSLTGTLGNTAMNVANGATFQGTGASAGSVTIQNGGNLAPGIAGVNNGVGTLTMAGLTLMSGANLNYDLSTPNVIGGTTNDRIQDNGQLTLGGTLHVNTLTGFGAGSYRIIDYTGALSNPNGLGVALPPGFNGVIQTAIPGQVNLIVSNAGTGPVQFWDGATTVGDGTIHGGTGTWTNSSNNTNWTTPNGNINQSWLGGFGIFAGNPGTVTVADTIHYTGLQFSTDGYVVNASGGGTLNPTGQATIRVDNGMTTTIGASIVGTGGLVVSGPGTLVLTANNAFSGGTTLAGGTLQIGNGATNATLGGNISITGNNTVLRFNQSIAVYDGSITQTAGSSTSLSFAGGHTVLSGPVTLTNAGNAASSIAANGTLQTNNTFALAGGLNLDGAITFAGPSASISGPINGTGLVQQNAGTVTFTAGASPTNYSGATIVNHGTLIAGAANSFSPVSATFVIGTLDLGGFAQTINNITLQQGTLQNGTLTGSVASFGGTIRNIGGSADVTLPVIGTTFFGPTSFAGTNTYTGPTNINENTARGANANAFSAVSPTSIAAGAALDLNGFNQTINSISGAGTIGNTGTAAATLTTGSSASTIFSGSIVDDGVTALTKVGSGTFTLTGTNTYTGPTTINAGALYVDGSIVSSSTVNTGALLGGSGRLGAVTLAGGTLAPGSQGTIGTLTIIGPLGFSASSFYNVRITPTANDQTNVTGAVTPGGASVNLTAASGPYTPGRRTIVTAGSVNGTFNPNVNTPAALAFLRPMLAYDATHVYLDLVGNAPSGAVDYRTAALTYNQLRVATGLTNAASLNPGGVGGAIIGALNSLTNAQAPGVFDALSGAGITATQNIAFDASKLVTSAMNDQGLFWREGGLDVNGITVAAPSFYASVKKGPFEVVPPPPPPPPVRTWRAWFTGFGQGERINGELPLGTSRQDNNLYGGVGGLDYQLLPNALIGVAAGGSSGHFNVPNLATSGSVDGAHIGAYGVTTFGPFYAQSSSTFSVYGNHTTRNIFGFGGLAGEVDRGDFSSRAWRSRFEVGDRFVWWDAAVTPFVAMEIAKLWSNAFTESGGILGLSVPASSHVSAPVFAGVRLEKAFVLSNGWVFTPNVSLAYVHEFSPVRDLFAGLTFLPASTFTVDGARPGRDAAQIKTGAKLALNPWAAVYANFEGEFSNRSQTYGGKGGVKVTW